MVKEQTQKMLLGGNTERRAKGMGVDRKTGHASEPGQVAQAERVQKSLALLKRREPGLHVSQAAMENKAPWAPPQQAAPESASLRQSPRNVRY